MFIFYQSSFLSLHPPLEHELADSMGTITGDVCFFRITVLDDPNFLFNSSIEGMST